jgi:predicted TIM-barrel enzyme
VQALLDTARSVNPDILVPCHDSPIAEPEDFAYVLRNARGIVGFLGTSSIERLPTEVAITDCVRRFKDIR